jgi:protein-S-isoprenylcysteine O-methyltransferase Ste14
MLTFVAWQVLPLVYIFTPWLAFAGYALPAWAGWLGAAVMAAALAVLWRAYHDLGKNWSPKLDVRAGQELVTDGIYGAIRHPIYAGLWLWALALPLLLHNWIAGFAIMVAEFGEAYRAYMARTGRVRPRL